MPDMENQTSGTSRRSFLKGALGAGAVAVGTLGAGATDSTATETQDRVEILVSTFGFFPGRTFRVVSRLDAATTIQLLRSPTGGTVPELSQPDDYSGYVVRYRLGGRPSAVTAFAFTRESLQVGDRYRLTETAQLFSPTLGLLRVTAVRVGTARRTTTANRTTVANRTTAGNGTTTRYRTATGNRTATTTENRTATTGNWTTAGETTG